MTDLVRMFRVENNTRADHPRTLPEPGREKFVGQWFSPQPKKALNYMKTAWLEGKPGAELLIAQVPEIRLPDFLASKIIAEQNLSLDIESSEDYLLPRDGSIDFERIALEGILGELYGVSDFFKIQHAQKAVLEYIEWTQEEDLRAIAIIEGNRIK
jgi:hypothetical protein